MPYIPDEQSVKDKDKLKPWERQQLEKGYLTWQEYLEAVKEDSQQVQA